MGELIVTPHLIFTMSRNPSRAPRVPRIQSSENCQNDANTQCRVGTGHSKVMVGDDVVWFCDGYV